MSDLFDLKDVYPLKSQQKIDRHEELLRKHTLTSKEEKELESLTVFVEKLPIGNGQKEIEGFEILRKFAKKIAQNQEN